MTVSENVTEKRLKILQEEINMLQLEERELQLRLTVIRKKQNKKMNEVTLIWKTKRGEL